MTEHLTFQRQWPRMREIILRVMYLRAVAREEWMDLNGLVNSICIFDDEAPEKIHTNLENIIVDYIEQAQQKVLVHQENQALLKAYVAEWSKYVVLIHTVPLPFDKLDFALAKEFPDRVPGGIVRNMIRDLWDERIFSRIQQGLRATAMQLVHSERTGDGEAFDPELVIGVRETYVFMRSKSSDKLGNYRENFERVYIDEIKHYYPVKALEYFEANGVQKYMKYADRKLKEEGLRAAIYLRIVSLGVLSESCVELLITTFRQAIFSEYAGMLKNNEVEKLHLMFRLMKREPYGVYQMLDELKDHIYNQGLADMLGSAEIITRNGEKYVEQLLELHARFSNLISKAFNHDSRFLKPRDKAFKRIVNDTSVFSLQWTSNREGRVIDMQPESCFSKLFANYCDVLLRKTPLSRTLTSDEVKARLKQVAVFLEYVKNKDVFMFYYEAHLRRRLILAISADNEKEEYMIKLLRDVGMPADYVIKLSQLFRDIKVCEDLKEKFKFTHRNNPGLVDALNFKILKADAWPSRASERVQVSLPSELTHFIPPVDDFYRQQHTGRKLQWYHHMSNGTITFTNKAGKYDLEVTTFQMAVLFAWNERKLDKISFEDLRSATQIPEAELRRTLWSLVACPKLKRQVLLHSPEEKSVKDFNYQTLFWINQDFSLIKNGKPQTKGKVNLIGKLQLSTEQSHQEENEALLRLRILRTQEAIVKIMKMRKKITNPQLRTQLVQVLENQFLPPENLIREQIEFLIEHGYLRRAQDNRNVFVRTP